MRKGREKRREKSSMAGDSARRKGLDMRRHVVNVKVDEAVCI